jgi:hypothetical protein
MSSPTPPGLPPQFPPLSGAPVPPKGKGPLFWILIAVAAVVVLGGCVITLGTYFVYRAAKNAGFDTTLMKNNPGLAVAKLAVAANPDLQTVSSNDDSGTITVRQKSTGEILNLRFDPDKKTLVASDKDGKEVEFKVSGDKDNGSFEIKSAEGNMKFGATSSNTMPAWVPTYPGSAPQGTVSMQMPEGSQNTYSFKTKDSASKVLDFYKKELETAGQKATLAVTGDSGGMLTAEDSAKGRTIMVTAGSSSEGSDVAVTVIEKKQP